jgi:hypothetical protein
VDLVLLGISGLESEIVFVIIVNGKDIGEIEDTCVLYFSIEIKILKF